MKNTSVVLLITLMLSMAPFNSQSLAAQPTGQANVPLSDGRNLLVGGEGTDGKPSKLIIVVSPDQGIAATSVADLHIPRTWSAATVLADGTVLITGGITSSGDLVDGAELYDMKRTSTTVIKGLKLTPRARHTATMLNDGNVLLAGGINDESQAIDSVDIIDTRNWTFETISNALAVARYDHRRFLSKTPPS